MRRLAPLAALAFAGCPHAGHPVAGGGVPTAPTWPDPPAADHALGVDGPVEVTAVARDGRWAILCQARADDSGDGVIDDTWDQHGTPWGDAMTPAIVVSSGAGVPFDDVLAISRDERWVAVHRGDAYVLFDTRAPSVTELGPAPRDAAGGFGGWATFTGDGAALLRTDGAAVVIRDLGSGAERRLDLGGPVWRVDGDAAGGWVRAEVLARDTDGDGAVAREWGLNTDSIPACAGPWTDADTFGAMGDEPEVVWIDTATDALVRDPDLVRPVGGHRLARAGTGVALDGAALGGKACAVAQVLAVLPEPLTVLLACGAGPTRFHVIDAGADHELAPDLGRQDDPLAPPPLVAAPVYHDGYAVDLTRGEAVAADGEVMLLDGRVGLFAQGDDLVAVDLITGTSRPVTTITEWGRRLAVGSVLAIQGMAVDAVTAQVLNEAAESRVVGADGAGRLLVAASSALHHFPRGPLHWQAPGNADPK